MLNTIISLPIKYKSIIAYSCVNKNKTFLYIGKRRVRALDGSPSLVTYVSMWTARNVFQAIGIIMKEFHNLFVIFYVW